MIRGTTGEHRALEQQASGHTQPQPSPPPSTTRPAEARGEDEADEAEHTEPRDEDEGDATAYMQVPTQLDETGASSSQAPSRERPAGGQPHRMAPAAAMVRRWLRQLAALLNSHPMGDTIPLLLEETMQVVGTCTEDDRWRDNGTIGGPGLCKKRRILNYLYIARIRLQDLCDDEGVDGYNQHQLYEDLKTALDDLHRGQLQFEQAVGGTSAHKIPPVIIVLECKTRWKAPQLPGVGPRRHLQRII